MTSWPCSASSAAATEESTPPDIAPTMRMVRSPSFVRRVRDARLARAVDGRARDRAQDCILQPVPKRLDAPSFLDHLRRRQAGSRSHADNGRYILRAGAAVPLVLPSGQKRLHPRSALDPEGAGSLRPVELVGREREQVDAEPPNVH